jgi:predicted nucleic acid-binding protein
VKYLLDVNVLVALAHQDHAEHDKAGAWFKSACKVASVFQTCAITELGFVRVSVQAGLSADLAAAQGTLAGMKRSSPVPFALIPDPLGAAEMPKYVRTPAQLTDGHLVRLAETSGARLATLDKGIPGAVLIA